jgi:hypothetical protein
MIVASARSIDRRQSSAVGRFAHHRRITAATTFFPALMAEARVVTSLPAPLSHIRHRSLD